MGLDMYLSAERQLGDEQAAAVLAALGKRAEELAPDEWGSGFYLSAWSYNPDDEPERQTTLAALKAAGLDSMLTEDSPGGEAVWQDGKLTVSVTCIYWRKANAIHAWFVDHCQEGRDECQLSDPIPAEQLAHLRSMCADAIAAYDAGDIAKAGEIMAPQAGFFFGSTEVDEWWAADLRHTVEQIEAVVREAIEIGGVTFRYQSSW